MKKICNNKWLPENDSEFKDQKVYISWIETEISCKTLTLWQPF